MTENLQAPLRDPSDIKLFILYLMEHIGRPLDFVEINDIVIQNGVVKPFDFCLAFPDLLETGHIRLTEENGHEWYSVTDLGRETERNLEGKILNVTKEKALENAILLLNMKKLNTAYRYHTKALLGGKFLLNIHFSEGEDDVLSLSVVTDTLKEAENMEIEFERHPELVHRAFLSLLKNNVQPIAEYDPNRLL